MPRIPESFFDAAAFLYSSAEKSDAHAKEGGTCFIIGHPLIIDGTTVAWVPYAVSNRHVVWDRSFPVLRVNRRGGEPPVPIDLDCLDWFPHPGNADVAIAGLLGKIDQAQHKISFIKTEDFITKEKAQSWELGAGDEVFMVGRFLNHQGKLENQPAARFGSISAMPSMIPKGGGAEQLSYAVEMRSRTGFSGSVVAAYRTIATVLTDVRQQNFFGILGVNWGYINDEDGENTWLNGVAPAWQILETLECSELTKIQNEAKEHWIRYSPNGGCEGVTLCSSAASVSLKTTAIDQQSIAHALALG